VIDVLNFLAAHPTESFTLAEIARHVGLSNGSAHRILTTLAGAQYLSRNEKHRTYALGAAVVAVGQAAIEKHRGIDVARREIARLAMELNVQCTVNTMVDDEILVLAKEGVAQSHLGLTRVGERRPLVPPVGLCLVAWGGDAAIRSYVAKAGAHLSEPMRTHLLAAFPVIRQRGFAIAALGPGSHKARQAMTLPGDQVRDAAYWSRVFELAAQLTPDELQLLDLADAQVGTGTANAIGYIAAPVFSPAGTVSLQVVLSGIPSDLSARDIRTYAERLCAAAAVITDETHGRRPQA
jgi:DNA-binding IclR family transcriptional regulator